MNSIPIVDISDVRNGTPAEKAGVVEVVERACRTVGFFFVSGHGVPMESIDALRAGIVAFFARPEEEKRRIAMTPERYSGYIPMASLSANAGTLACPDRYEGFKLHAEPSSARTGTSVVPFNVWPDDPPDFRNVVMGYWRDMDRLALRLTKIFAAALNQDEGTFLRYFGDPMSNMTLLHYPPMGDGDAGYGIHPHKDTDAFTILYPDPVGGLEVRPIDGDWIVADCPPGAFIVNIGDMMELWSGGRFRSTPHKVTNRTGRERYSFPYFATPNETVTIEPLVPRAAGYDRPRVHVGTIMGEVYRTNRADQEPRDAGLDLGTLDD